jgi:hypothetical protein
MDLLTVGRRGLGLQHASCIGVSLGDHSANLDALDRDLHEFAAGFAGVQYLLSQVSAM